MLHQKNLCFVISSPGVYVLCSVLPELASPRDYKMKKTIKKQILNR